MTRSPRFTGTPQVIMMLDRTGRVIQARCALGGARLAALAANVKYGRGVHEIVHPGCAGCELDAAWSHIWDAFDSSNIPETEIEDPRLGAVLRLRLQGPLRLDGESSAGQAYCSAVLTVNDITEHRAAQLRRVQRLLVVAEENERQRIAAELHDGVCQSLGTLKYRLEALYNDPAVPGKNLAPLSEQVRRAIDEIRRIATNLAPPTLDDPGIKATLETLCAEFRSSHPGTRVYSRFEVDERQIPAILKAAMHRMTQEALNNISAHAAAREVSVSLVADNGGVELCIRDDGVGFDWQEVDQRAGRRHFGLCNMRNRIAATSGTLQIDSNQGAGTEICARWDAAELLELSALSLVPTAQPTA